MLERLTPEAKRVIERSLRESLQLGYAEIRTEHLLLAMLHETASAAQCGRSSVTGKVLSRYPTLRREIIAELKTEEKATPKTLGSLLEEFITELKRIRNA